LVKKARGRELAHPIDMPLVVVVAKFDAWAHMVKGGLPPYAASSGDDSVPLHGFRAAEVEAVSERLRELLVRLCPAIVTAAERFCRTVCYIPTSATGCPPSVVGFSDTPPPETPKPIYRFRKSAIAPMWAEVPLLWILSRLTTGLLPVAQSKESG
jgi:hypothetical protein